MDEKKREDIALFRYSLIVPFLSREELEWGVKGEMLQRMVDSIYAIPFSEKSSLTESTIRRYLYNYRKNGFDGLKPKSRDDIGKSRNISAEILEKAFLLKREEPRRSAEKIIQIMEAHNWVTPGLIKPSTLYRIFKHNHLTCKQLKKSQKDFRHFQAELPNQIWQSDTLYGPYLPDPDRPGAKKQTFLVAILDDFSRLVPHAQFYWREKLPFLENTLHKAFIKRGIPEILYVDNGQVYNAHQINTICAELGIRKINCKPYSPEGKGKIERFFRTVRNSFLVELEHEKVEHLHQLNSKFWAWLEMEYHQKQHSTTEQTPNSRWRDHVNLRKIDEKQLQSIFLWRENRKVSKTGLVSLQGLQFEVASFLAGKRVEIRYNHFDLAKVFIYMDGRFIQNAKQARISRWNTAQKRSKTGLPSETVKSGIKHLQHLENQHLETKVRHAREITGKTAPKSQFTQAHFIKAVAEVLKRKVEDLHAKELDELQQAWSQFGPFEPDLLHIALAKAQLDKGTDQHISFYLKYVINTQTNNSKEQTK